MDGGLEGIERIKGNGKKLIKLKVNKMPNNYTMFIDDICVLKIEMF